MRRFASIVETVPTPCRICGTALRPFSLGHHLMFVRLGLPFANSPQGRCTVDEFFQAVFICAHAYEENIEGHLSGEWARRREQWFKRLRKGKREVAAGLEFFRAHLAEGYRMAPVWRHSSGQSVSMSAPWEQLLRVRLVMAGFSASEVMNAYLPAAWYDYFTALELERLESTADPKNWKKVFYTLQDAVEDEAASLAAGPQEVPA